MLFKYTAVAFGGLLGLSKAKPHAGGVRRQEICPADAGQQVLLSPQVVQYPVLINQYFENNTVINIGGITININNAPTSLSTTVTATSTTTVTSVVGGGNTATATVGTALIPGVTDIAGTFVLQVGAAAARKRQALGGFLADDASTMGECGGATQYNLTGGQLFASTGGQVSTDVGASVQVFGASASVGAITTVFSSSNGELIWTNDNFYQGTALFCFDQGTLSAVFTENTGDCMNTVLNVVSVAECGLRSLPSSSSSSSSLSTSGASASGFQTPTIAGLLNNGGSAASTIVPSLTSVSAPSLTGTAAASASADIAGDLNVVSALNSGGSTGLLDGLPLSDINDLLNVTQSEVLGPILAALQSLISKGVNVGALANCTEPIYTANTEVFTACILSHLGTNGTYSDTLSILQRVIDTAVGAVGGVGSQLNLNSTLGSILSVNPTPELSSAIAALTGLLGTNGLVQTAGGLIPSLVSAVQALIPSIASDVTALIPGATSAIPSVITAVEGLLPSVLSGLIPATATGALPSALSAVEALIPSIVGAVENLGATPTALVPTAVIPPLTGSTVSACAYASASAADNNLINVLVTAGGADTLFLSLTANSLTASPVSGSLLPYLTALTHLEACGSDNPNVARLSVCTTPSNIATGQTFASCILSVATGGTQAPSSISSLISSISGAIPAAAVVNPSLSGSSTFSQLSSGSSTLASLISSVLGLI